jgi:four helix bundle protein
VSAIRRLEDWVVYRKLCQLHIEVCALTHQWPSEERYELGSQVRRSSNSCAAQLADKYDDRHVRHKIEGVNRSRGEAAETIHHVHIAFLKGYEPEEVYDRVRERYQDCIQMLNGMERTLGRFLPERDRRWPEKESEENSAASFHEVSAEYSSNVPEGYLESTAPEP